MKRSILLAGLATLAVTATTGMALAQDRPARADRMARIDTDGDSRISQTEFVTARVSRLSAADADGNGTVSAEERRAAGEAARATRAAARFDRLDADRSGTITRAEFDAARPERGARDPRAGRGPGGEARGGEGRRAERANRDVVIADAQSRTQQAFARLDANGDGFLTMEERRAGRVGMREQRRERMAERRAARQASPSTPVSE